MTAPSPGYNQAQLGTLARLFEIMSPALTLIGGAAPDKPFTHVFGRRYLMASASHPRIIWVPSQDRFDDGVSQAFPGPGGRIAKSRHTRKAGCDLYIHGASTDQVELALNEILVYFSQHFNTSYEVYSGRWKNEDDSWSADGEAYVLSVAFAIPVLPVEYYVKAENIELCCACEDET